MGAPINPYGSPLTPKTRHSSAPFRLQLDVVWVLFLFLLVGFGLGYFGACSQSPETVGWTDDDLLPQAERRRRFLVSYGPWLIALYGAALLVSLVIELT